MKSKEVTEGADLAPENEEVIVRKALIMSIKHYHPETNKGLKTKKDRSEQIKQMADFLTSFIPCELEEATKIATEVIDEVRGLSVEELNERSERSETIGAVINKVVGNDILPALLPDNLEIAE